MEFERRNYYYNTIEGSQWSSQDRSTETDIDNY